MPIESNFTPVLEEQQFATKILAAIAVYEKSIVVAKSAMSELDLRVSRQVKSIINANDDAKVMIDSIIIYLKSDWSFQDILYSLVCIEGLKDKLLNIVGQLDKDCRIKALTANNSKLLSETVISNKHKAQKEKELKSQHQLEVQKLKKDALLDKKHLEKSVESLSSIIKEEVGSLKDIMMSKGEELRKLQAENARLLQLACKLQQQVHSKKSASSHV
jgi:hypothetical protein